MGAEALGTRDETLDVDKGENNNSGREKKGFGHYRMVGFHGDLNCEKCVRCSWVEFALNVFFVLCILEWEKSQLELLRQ